MVGVGKMAPVGRLGMESANVRMMKCPRCGALVIEGRECPQCSGGRKASDIGPANPATDSLHAAKSSGNAVTKSRGGSTFALVILAVLLGVGGLVFLFAGVTGTETEMGMIMRFADTLLGIGLIAAGCLVAILARIAQARRQSS